MDASMISLLSGPFSTSAGSSFQSDSTGGEGFAGWGWDLFDDNGRPIEPEPSKTYAETAEGRRERLDDLMSRIADAKARHEGVR